MYQQHERILNRWKLWGTAWLLHSWCLRQHMAHAPERSQPALLLAWCTVDGEEKWEEQDHQTIHAVSTSCSALDFLEFLFRVPDLANHRHHWSSVRMDHTSWQCGLTMLRSWENKLDCTPCAYCHCKPIRALNLRIWGSLRLRLIRSAIVLFSHDSQDWNIILGLPLVHPRMTSLLQECLQQEFYDVFILKKCDRRGEFGDRDLLYCT